MYPPPIDRDAAVRRPYSGEAAPGVIGKEFLERLGFNIGLGTGRGYGQVGLGIGNPPPPLCTGEVQLPREDTSHVGGVRKRSRIATETERESRDNCVSSFRSYCYYC